MLLELLRDAPNYRYNPDARILAFALHVSDIEQVRRIVCNYGLYDIDNEGLLYSPWLVEQLDAYDNHKQRLSAAGKKGAARRWNKPSSEDGLAIAYPSSEDGNAIAPNITIPNVRVSDITNPTNNVQAMVENIIHNPGKTVDDDYVDMLTSTQPDGHNPGWVAAVCRQYGAGEAVCNWICEASDNACLTNPLYIRFCALIKRIQAEKWHPNNPNAFLIRKMLEQ